MGQPRPLAPSSGSKYNHFRAPTPSIIQRRLAVGFGGLAWFWIMYRLSKEYKSFFGKEFHFGGAVDQEFDLDEFAFYKGDEHLLPKF